MWNFQLDFDVLTFSRLDLECALFLLVLVRSLEYGLIELFSIEIEFQTFQTFAVDHEFEQMFHVSVVVVVVVIRSCHVSEKERISRVR